MIQLSGAGQALRPQALVRECRLADHARIPHWSSWSERHRQVHRHENSCGSESLDYGAISRAKGISIGYLPQDGLTLTGRTIFAECPVRVCRTPCHRRRNGGAHPQHVGTRPRGPGILERRRPLPETRHEFVAPTAYARSPRSARSHRSWLPPRRLERAGLKNSPRRQMRIRAGQTAAAEAQPAAARTSPPTISISKPATGLRSYLTTYPYAFVLIRTIR